MKLWLFFILLPVANADPTAVVWARDPAAVRKFFPAEKYLMLDAAQEATDQEQEGYIPPRRRNALLHKLDLEDAVGGLDEMDKDILVIDARDSELPELKKWYPMLSEKQLRELKREVTAKK